MSFHQRWRISIVAAAYLLAAMPAPAWSGEPRVLNNFVTELLNVPDAPAAGREFEFVNPRDGWVFVASKALVTQGEIVISMRSASGDDDQIITHRPGTPENQEAMRCLPAGAVQLQVKGAEESQQVHLVVRAIPEILYGEFPHRSRVAPYPEYTWQWLSEVGMLDAVNTIIGARDHADITPLAAWKAQGRKWIEEAGRPALNKPHIRGEDEFQQLRQHRAMNEPRLDGIIVDEFTTSLARDPAMLTEYVKVFRMMGDDRSVGHHRFYPYVAGNPAVLSPLIKSAVEGGFNYAYEIYLSEQADEEAELQYLDEELIGTFETLQKAIPDAQKQAIVALSLMCTPPEDSNTNPQISFKAHLDRQMWIMANAPQLRGLGGISGYHALSSDEEYLRWYARLCRHYCIEGNTTPLSNDPMTLKHVRNPDFARGLEEWTVSASNPADVVPMRVKSLGEWQGRYKRVGEMGDTCVRFRRNPSEPNRISQILRGLEPGRAYSVKLITGDIGALHALETHVLSIAVDKAEVIPECGFVHPYRSWSALDEHETRNPCFNLHFYVFRATTSEAELTISDWAAMGVPGGAIGQELIVNFVEVEPYFEKRTIR